MKKFTVKRVKNSRSTSCFRIMNGHNIICEVNFVESDRKKARGKALFIAEVLNNYVEADEHGMGIPQLGMSATF